MTIKQISVFLENKRGRLAEVTGLLGQAGINIRALTVADTADFGVLRMIVSQPEEAVPLLKANGFTTKETQVLAVEIPDRPGGLSEVLKHLAESDMDVEYIYCFVDTRQNAAIDVMRVEDTDLAIKVLTAKGWRVLEEQDVYSM